MTVQSRAWRIVDPRAIHYREFEDEVVVYNGATGSTHHLTPVGRAVLMALLQHPEGLESLDLFRMLHVAVEHAEPIGDGFERTLEALMDLELVDCVTV
jgi:hypothetical protein